MRIPATVVAIATSALLVQSGWASALSPTGAPETVNPGDSRVAVKRVAVKEARENQQLSRRTGRTTPVSRTYAPKKIGGRVIVTRKPKTVKVTFKHQQARSADLAAYDPETNHWNYVSGGKTKRARAIWRVAPQNTRVKVRLGTGESLYSKGSGSLRIPGKPATTAAPTKPKPTGPPPDMTPPPLSPTPYWDWDEFDYWWPEFRCDYEDIQTHSDSLNHPKIQLYQVFCDPHVSTPGDSGSGSIYDDGMTACTVIDGTRGLVYEVAYTIRLHYLRLGGGNFTNYATWGRNDIKAHDIEPGSAHLNSSGQLSYTPRTRSIPPTQDSVVVVLPFHDTEALNSDNQLVAGKPLTAKPEDAYGAYNRDTSPKYGSNVRPILSWVSTATYFRPATWERDVWGVPGVNGRIPAIGRSQRDFFNSPHDIIEWVRENNAAELSFRSDSVLVPYGISCS